MESGNTKKTETGLVFSIQHFCLHDGPGIRSLVFFKGCPLRCAWCQNPESWKPIPELGFKAHLCTDCRTCISACPTGTMKIPGQIQSDKCRQCFACAEACPSGALIRFGNVYSTQEIMEELLPEYPFYQNSGGGVTFSGGEPTLFPEVTAQLAGRLKQDDIHLAIETCGMFDINQAAVGKLMNHVDLVLFDIKLFDQEAHHKHCGTSNSIIKDTLKTLAHRFHQKEGPLLWPRMPVIPGITDTVNNLEGWGSILAELKLNKLTLVPFHKLGEAKREWLQLKPGPPINTLASKSMDKTRLVLTEFGITCCEPGEEDWMV